MFYALEVPTGERGELWLKGPNIMKVHREFNHMLVGHNSHGYIFYAF